MNRPFTRYEDRGLRLLGIPPEGDGTARFGYGRPVFAECGYRCVYCGFEMAAPYEAWLSLSIDHVIPAHVVKAGWPREWVLDRINLVTSCRACNEFLNAYRLADMATPRTLEDFIAVRDRVFDQKTELSQTRHRIEQERYIAARPAGPTEAQQELREHGTLDSGQASADGSGLRD